MPPQPVAELAVVPDQRVHGRPGGQSAAVVDLDEVDPPGREGPRVLVVMVPARGQALAGPGADRRVKAEPQAEGVNLAGPPADSARELRGVPGELAARVTCRGHPPVVQVDAL